MGILDIFFLVPIVWLAYVGFKKGLIIELSTLLALILGVFVSLYFSDITADFLKDIFDLKTKYLKLISFIITFLLVVIAVNLVGKLIEKFVNMVSLSFLNKSAGGLFGVLKAVIFLSLLVFFIEKVDKKKNVLSTELTESSIFYEYIQPIAPTLIDAFSDVDFDIDPKNLKDKVMNPQI
jgi:membrane protein required for colicin V production